MILLFTLLVIIEMGVFQNEKIKGEIEHINIHILVRLVRVSLTVLGRIIFIKEVG